MAGAFGGPKRVLEPWSWLAPGLVNVGCNVGAGNSARVLWKSGQRSFFPFYAALF